MKKSHLSIYLSIYLSIVLFPCVGLRAQTFATRVFAQPGVRFMQKMNPDEGSTVSISGLPDGLEWNAKRNLIEGTITENGTYSYTATVTTDGTDEEYPITLTVSDTLAQPTPFMGLLTWNMFEADISQEKLEAIADAFVDYGLLDAGYKYVCIDDQWALGSRSSSGHLQPDPDKFPDGIKVVSDYMHERGLKLGIYSDGGSYTCSGAQPGSWKSETIDAKDFADWGVDLLKYDYCYAPDNDPETAKTVYGAMGDALATYCPSDFIFYMCEWGDRYPWQWGSSVGGTCWRATADTRDCWINSTYKGGVKDNIDVFKNIWAYTGVNAFSDADMMMCGLHGQGKSSNAGTSGNGMTQNEYWTQFVLWCMWSSPLTITFDVTAMGDGISKCGLSYNNTEYYKEDLAMVTNAELIAIDQDALAQCAEPIYDNDDYIAFQKDLLNGDVAISVTNLSSSTISIPLNLADFTALEEGVTYYPRDLINGKGYANEWNNETEYNVVLKTHATRVYRLIRNDNMTDSIRATLTDTLSAGEVIEVEPYAINYDKEGNRTHSRTLQSVSLGSQTIENPSTGKVYQDLTNLSFIAKAGENVTPAFQMNGIWMNGYVYIDRESDGEFSADVNSDGTIVEGSDLMSYSFYSIDRTSDSSGYNSNGQYLEGSSRNVLSPPAFTIPQLEEGFYMMRWKMDWNSIDPGGSLEGNPGGAFMDNGGDILDTRLRIYSEGTTYTVSVQGDDYNLIVTEEGNSLNGSTVTLGEELRFKFDTDKKITYELSGMNVMHGILSGDSIVNNVAQRVATSIDITPDDNGIYTIPGDIVDGDISLQVDMEIDEDSLTDIVTIFCDEANDASNNGQIYDIFGRSVSGTIRPGIYIIGDKKVMVK